MMELDKRRLSNSLAAAIKGLEQEAFCYRYNDEPEYQTLIEGLKTYRRELKENSPLPVPLTLEALKELVWAHRLGVHVWIKIITPEGEYVTPALTDVTENDGIVAIWCVDPQFPPLKEAHYGKIWLAYLDNPLGAAEWGDFDFTDDIFENGRED